MVGWSEEMDNGWIRVEEWNGMDVKRQAAVEAGCATRSSLELLPCARSTSSDAAHSNAIRCS